MRVNMVIDNVPSLRARISAAAIINVLSQLLSLFYSDAYSHKYGNWYLKILLHLGQNVITFRTLLHLGPFITFRPSTNGVRGGRIK